MVSKYFRKLLRSLANSCVGFGGNGRVVRYFGEFGWKLIIAALSVPEEDNHM